MTVILSDLLLAALNEIKDSKTLTGLDDIRVYNSVLTSANIAELYAMKN